jgi:hypothetical protein
MALASSESQDGHQAMALASSESQDDEEDIQLPFRKCFSFGTSLHNIRIERWWRSLAASSLNEYRTYFESLAHKGLFSDVPADRIALKYVYMPLIRERVYGFVEVHNSHRIRKQPMRSHYLPVGKPRILFSYPKTGDYHVDIHEETLQWLEDIISELDIDSYLPPSMIDLRSQFCFENGYPEEVLAGLKFNRQHPHKQVYLTLRQSLRLFYTNGGELEEEESLKGSAEALFQYMEAREDKELAEAMDGQMFLDLDRDDPIDGLHEEDYSDDDRDDSFSVDGELELDYIDYEGE